MEPIMGNPSFDISSLQDFKPAKAHCQKCYGLHKVIPHKKQQIQCQICGVQYVVQGHSQIEKFRSHFKERGLYIELNDNVKHIERLGSIASRLRQYKPNYSPINGLLEGLNQAQSFVHFTTFGTCKEILGYLKYAAQNVKVRGIVSIPSNQENWLLPELENYKNEAPNLEIRIVRSSNWQQLPHQKLLVIDGLVAFTGGANLTLTGWRKASRGYDHVEVITDLDKVIELHNRLFSPRWAELSNYGDTIAIGNELIDDNAA
jgi:phosphatidylserine/phosphatidylglycerophosphate/cardiolipin synthase-like enzyme